jgi:hypothetical protein
MAGQKPRNLIAKLVAKLVTSASPLAILIAFALAPVASENAWAKGREKFITREAKSAKGGKGDKTKVNFDEVDIGGQRKTPLGSLVNNNRLDRNYDFIKLRQRWHPEMIESASSLESGGR